MIKYDYNSHDKAVSINNDAAFYVMGVSLQRLKPNNILFLDVITR
ncbi:Putative uncharacterized protein [Moritella viscosa]|nr:Putative uncharacterized protein [Moritella viscosa]